MKTFSTLSALLVAALSLQPQVVAAGYPRYKFQAFTGGNCDGDADAEINFPRPSGDTKYIDFSHRFSFKVTLPDDGGNQDGEYLAYVTACRKAKCDGGTTGPIWSSDSTVCVNVNTGYGVNGMSLFTTYGGI